MILQMYNCSKYNFNISFTNKPIQKQKQKLWRSYIIII